MPIALFVGTQDQLANVNDNRMLRDMLPYWVFYEEVEQTHGSFLTGRDMSYFERVIQLTVYYNPVNPLTPATNLN